MFPPKKLFENKLKLSSICVVKNYENLKNKKQEIYIFIVLDELNCKILFVV
jgi:hypothetical protein